MEKEIPGVNRVIGRTTRLADQAVQDYFNTGSADIIDHYPSPHASLHLLNRVCGRLSTEHRQENNINYIIESLRVGNNNYYKIVRL